MKNRLSQALGTQKFHLNCIGQMELTDFSFF